MFNIDFTKYRIVDLSYEVVPPGTEDRPFVMKRGYLIDRAFKYDIVRTHSHVGTHVEAPAHFFENGKDVTEIPLTRFMGRAVLLDIPNAQAAMIIDADYLSRSIGDIICDGDIVICRNSDPASLRSENIDDKPCLSRVSAHWLAEHNIKMLGIDNHFRLGENIEDGRALHDILQSQDVCLVEFLDNLHELRQRIFFFMALPWKVKTMDSSWARAVAIEEK